MSAQLQGRVALVTGAGRGIGREIALGLARDGARVALLARTTEEIDGVAHEITVLGDAALALTADIGDGNTGSPGGQRRARPRAAVDRSGACQTSRDTTVIPQIETNARETTWP